MQARQGGEPAPDKGRGSAGGQWLLGVEASASLPTLVIFPHAGAGAAAYWKLALSVREVARGLIVRLPGRESRLTEPLFTDVRPVIRALAPVLRPQLSGDFILYGHSMGALIAFETARLFSLAYGMHPRRLIVSGMEAPQDCPTGHDRHLMTDEQLWRLVTDMGGLPPEVAAEPTMRQMLLPALRADFQITDEYAFRATPLLSCPISAYAGRLDAELAPSTMLGWQAHTTGEFEHTVLPGEHFFNLDSDSGFPEALEKLLAR